MPWAGVIKTISTSNPIDYYLEVTVTNLYVQYSFGNSIDILTISNDSMSDTIQISYDGATLEGDLKAGETKTFSVRNKSSVYIKGTAGGDKARIWGS